MLDMVIGGSFGRNRRDNMNIDEQIKEQLIIIAQAYEKIKSLDSGWQLPSWTDYGKRKFLVMEAGCTAIHKAWMDQDKTYWIMDDEVEDCYGCNPLLVKYI